MSTGLNIFFKASELRYLLENPAVTHVQLEFPSENIFPDKDSSMNIEAYGLDDKEQCIVTALLKTCPRPCP